MPFMVNINFGNHLLNPLWSIGVEELFYLGWAPLFKFLNKYLLILASVIILIKMLIDYFLSQGIIDDTFASLISMLQFDAMAIGALGGYWLYHKSEDISTHFLFSGWMQVVMFSYLIGRFLLYNYLLALHPIFALIYNTPFISNLFLLFSFLWLILNISTNSNTLLNLDIRIFDYLGDISYGIYMYHMIVLFSIILILSKTLSSLGLIVGTLLFYFLLTTGVILVAGFSRKYFEDPFLKLKKRF